MKNFETAVRAGDSILILINPSIVRTAGIRNGTLFEERLTEAGISAFNTVKIVPFSNFDAVVKKIKTG